MPSKIEWLWMPGYMGEQWNPITGCTKTSPGCANCYAEGFAKRFNRNGGSYLPGEAIIQFMANRIDDPSKWRSPRMCFINSVSDLFHEDVQNWWIDTILAIVAMHPRHIFVGLTKRAIRMAEYFDNPGVQVRIETEMRRRGSMGDIEWPIPNLWLGVSVENQHWADERIPLLRNVPTVVRWISVEPLLGPIKWAEHLEGIDWFVVGGESGVKARPMHPNWVGEGIAAADAHSIPVFFKQWGAHRPWVDVLDEGKNRKVVEVKYKRGAAYGWTMVKVGKGEAGASLSVAGFLEDKRQDWPQYGLRYGM